MQTVTDDSQLLAEVAARHGVSTEAATHVQSALAAGGGRQAQFNHPELGGMGQWSQGGMTMIGDMFNPALKARVAALCNELADALDHASGFVRTQGQRLDPPIQHSDAGTSSPASTSQRWPVELGTATSRGSQNNMHYAVFPDTRRLAIEQDGRVTVYDTGDHRIGGVSQQQSGDQTLQFTSQSGVVRLADLPIVPNEPTAAATPAAVAAPAPSAANASPPGSTVPDVAAGDDEIFSRLERLSDLHSRAIISSEEFAAKKAELLGRL